MPQDVFVIVDFGQPAKEHEAEVWLALAEANFVMFGQRAPTFARNPATKGVALQMCWPLHIEQVPRLLAALGWFSQLALDWRQGFFRDPENFGHERGFAEALIFDKV